MKERGFAYGLALITILAVVLRAGFSPEMNFETDSFSVLLSAKNLAERGSYEIPAVRLSDTDGRPVGWAVGYPLLLSLFFSLVGYSEAVARWATILLSAAPIPLLGAVGYRLQSAATGLAAALLMALDPVLVSISGRILTANPATALYAVSLALLLLAVLRRDGDELRIADFSDDRHRPSHPLFIASFVLLGVTLSIRDDYAMFGLPFAYLFLRVFRPMAAEAPMRVAAWLATAGACVLVGFLPNLYYNVKTYGGVFVSSHVQYGGTLSFDYLLNGNGGAMGLPGWIVVLLTLLIFMFPVVGAAVVWRGGVAGRLIGVIVALIVVPMVVIVGAYPTTSSGSSPRYMMVLAPLAALAAALLLTGRGYGTLPRRAFCVAVIAWMLVLYRPPARLFAAVRQSAYLAHYSPWYNTHTYMNYPRPVRASLEWVETHVPPEAVILSDYDYFHYFVYAGRDVMSRDIPAQIAQIAATRPVFFVEDHQSAINPATLDDWARQLAAEDLGLEEVGALPLFSPVKGPMQLKIYRLVLGHQ